MMRVAGVNFKDECLKKADEQAGVLGISRSEYINRLIALARLRDVRALGLRLKDDNNSGGADERRCHRQDCLMGDWPE